jgi:hypothetical protein
MERVRLRLSGRRGRTDGPRGRSRPAKERVHRRPLHGGTSARLRRRHPRRRLAGEPRRGPRPGCRNGPTPGRLLPTLRPGDQGWPGRRAAGRGVAVPASPSPDTTGRVRRRADQPRTRPTPTAAGCSARPRGSSRSAPARHRSLLHRDTAGSSACHAWPAGSFLDSSAQHGCEREHVVGAREVWQRDEDGADAVLGQHQVAVAMLLRRPGMVALRIGRRGAASP